MNPPQLPDPAREIEVTCTDVARLAPRIGAGMVVLVDCREPHEWAFNHLPNSYHLPLGEITGANAVPAPLCGVPVMYIVIMACVRSRPPGALRAVGHPSAYSMAGGIDRWSLEIDAAVPRY